MTYFVGMPRFCFQLRVSHPANITGAIRSFDEAREGVIHSLFGVSSLSSLQMQRIHLPLTLSGFKINIPSAALLSSAVYVGSVFSSLPLQSRMLGLDSATPLQEESANLVTLFNHTLQDDSNFVSFYKIFFY